MGKILEVTFDIPKGIYKGANIAVGHIIAAQKTSKIKELAAPIWESEITRQFGITPVEPTDVKTVEMKSEVASILDELKFLEDSFDKATAVFSETKKWRETRRKEIASELRVAKKMFDHELIIHLEDELAEGDRKLAEAKADLARMKTHRTTTKKNVSAPVKKGLRRVETQNQKLYTDAKIEVNEFQHIFKKCHMLVICYNITARSFDPSNGFPTTKAIVDSGTRVGTLWADDDLNTLLSTTFIGVGKSPVKDHYRQTIVIAEDLADITARIVREVGNSC